MRKILAFVLLFCTVFSLFSVFAAADAAEDPKGEYRRMDLSQTDVMDDLKAVEKDQEGKAGAFKLSDYPANPFSQKFVFLSLTESFRLDENGNRQYGLYLYLYNPGQLEVVTTAPHLQNALQFSVDGYNGGHFNKFGMTLCSYSTNKLFYKFKINVPEGFARNLSLTSRTYDISGIEIAAMYTGSIVTVRDHSGSSDGKVDQTISIKYAGYGPSTCKQISGEDVVHLDLEIAYYRVSNGSDQNQYKQLMTAWFVLPKEYVDAEGKVDLRFINYLCEKKADQTVMVDTGIGQLFESTDMAYNGNTYRVNKPLKLLTSVEHYAYVETGRKLNTRISYVYHYDLFSTYPLTEMDTRSYLIKTNKRDERSIDSQNLIDVICPFYLGKNPTASDLYDLMTDPTRYSYAYDGGYTQIGANVDLNDPENYYNTESYKQATSNFTGFFKRASDYGFFEAVASFRNNSIEDDSLTDLQLFSIVDPSDSNLSIQDFSKKYKVSPKDVSPIRSKAYELRNSGDYVCLFRFDLTDYSVLYTGTPYESWRSGWPYPDYLTSSEKISIMRYDNDGHVDLTCSSNNTPRFYKMTMYRNFDILDLTFGSPESFRIVPINADPVLFFAADIEDVENLRPTISQTSLFDGMFGKIFPFLIASAVVVLAVALIGPLSRASGKVYDGVSKAGKSVVNTVKKIDTRIRQKKKRKKK